MPGTSHTRRSLGVEYHGITVMDPVRERAAVNHKPLDTRFYEWVASLAVLALGSFILFYDINIARGSILAVARNVLGGIYGVGISTFLIGVFCIAALVANGRSHMIGPCVRIFAAIYRVIFWFWFVESMAQLTPTVQSWISPMVIVFSVISGGELAVIFIAGRHARPCK